MIVLVSANEGLPACEVSKSFYQDYMYSHSRPKGNIAFDLETRIVKGHHQGK